MRALLVHSDHCRLEARLAPAAGSLNAKYFRGRPRSGHSLPYSVGTGSHTRRKVFQVSAKKKKSGGQKKGPGSVIDIPKPQEAQADPHTTEAGKAPYEDTDVVMINLLVIENYRRKLGRPIMEGGDVLELTKDLYAAPFALLYHSFFVVEEPTFMYANKAALDLLEASWEALIGTPSSQSASQEEQASRQGLLKETAEKGWVHIYGARRQSLKGRPFEILDGTLFNVEGPDGNKIGQATVIRHWRFDDGTAGGPNAPEPAVNAVMLQEAQEYATQQGQLVRELKEGKGLSNSDPEVQEAVEELVRRKQAAERIEATLGNGSPPIN